MLNAAAVLMAGDMVATLDSGVKLAQKTIDSGKATSKLEQLIELSRNLTQE